MNQILEIPSIVSWQRAAVLGLGLSGRAAARLLLDRGVDVIAIDRRPAAELELSGLGGSAALELHAGSDEGDLPERLDALVISPGVDAGHPLAAAARAAGVPVLAEVELAWRLLDGPVAAITGSNGKSTTTAMTGALLAGAGFDVEVCGNIGVPLSSVVEGAPGRRFVVELSSFQLEATDELHPRAAALLNVSPDHLDRHGDLSGYLAAKRRIFARMGGDDVAVLNADDPDAAATLVSCRARFFSRLGAVEDGCFLDGERVVERAPGEEDAVLFHLGDLPLPGPHNLENAMAAALLARALGAAAESLAASLRAFQGLPHRLERIGEHDGVAFFDDSKGTNIGATERSLEGFRDGSVHWIAGGRNKGADFAGLSEVVARKVRRAYLIGESANELGAAIGDRTEIVISETLERAVRDAAAAARAGESVVLSPACASFDQFRDYADRGRAFQRAVAALEKTAAATTERGGDGQEAGL